MMQSQLHKILLPYLKHNDYEVIRAQTMQSNKVRMNNYTN